MNRLFIKKNLSRLFVGLVGLSLSACLSDGSDSKDTKSSPVASPAPVVSDKTCSASTPYDVALKAQDFYQNSKLHFHQIENKKWFGNKVVFDKIDDLPLGVVHLSKETLILNYLMLPHDHSDPRKVAISMNSYRGQAIQPEALEFKVIQKEALSPHWKIALSDCDDQNVIPEIELDHLEKTEKEAHHKRKPFKRFKFSSHQERNNRHKEDHDSQGDEVRDVWEAVVVSVTIHLEKFIFGGQFSATDILNDANDGSGRIVFEIHGAKGFAKILSASLNLQGNQPGSCPVPTPVPTPTPAPKVQIDSTSVSGLTNQTDVTVIFSADQSTGFQCSLDLQPYNSCSSPFSAIDLTDGPHQFSVRGVTSDGRIGDSASFNWSIDATAPELKILSVDPLESLTSTNHFSISFETNENAIFSCQLDGSIWSACSSPFSQNNLADGSHTFSTKAQDAAGNMSSVVSYSWSVKTFPPAVDITLVIPSASPSNVNSRAFSFMGTNGATQFYCRLDLGLEVSCNSPYQLNSIQEGAHVFSVFAVDGAGNRSVAATNSFSIDMTAPEVSITSILPGQNPTPSDSLQITFSSNESGTFLCSLDGATSSTCMSPMSWAGLTEGAHHFQVHAIDLAGNMSPIFAEYNWTIDRIAPSVSLMAVNPASSTISQDNISFSFTVSETASSSCGLDGTPGTDCSSGFVQFAGLTDGVHSISIVATDLAGNQSSPVMYSFTVDTMAPVVQILSVQPIETITNSNSLTITFGSNEAGSFECRLDAGNYVACLSPRTYVNLSDGSHQLLVRAVDQAGNVSTSAATYSWVVDTVAPNVTLTSSSVQSGEVSATTGVSFSFSSNETGVSFVCQLDNLGFQACSSPATYSGLSDGAHQFDVAAIDSAGNTTPTPTSISWTVDASPIVISNLSVSSITRTSAVITWLTNRPTTSQVAYAVSGSSPLYVFTTVNGALVTSHSVTVSGLTSLTLYTAYAISTDAFGMQQSSSTLSFKTAR
jgi:hypothetical protein